MASIRLDKVTKRFGSVTALQGVSLEVADGEFFAVLGPRCRQDHAVANDHRSREADEGDVSSTASASRTSIRGTGTSRSCSRTSLFTRQVGHNNLAFPSGRRRRRRPRSRGESTRQRPSSISSTCSSASRRSCRAASVSGSRPARVVRDRARSCSTSPLSALDALLRLEMRAELKRLQRDLGRRSSMSRTTRSRR